MYFHIYFILSYTFISYFLPKPVFGSTSTTVCYKATVCQLSSSSWTSGNRTLHKHDATPRMWRA